MTTRTDRETRGTETPGRDAGRQHPGPAKLWLSLDPASRALAARALYAHRWDDASTKREADGAVAEAMHFRAVAVRNLPVEKRAGYLAKMVRPDDSLATSLLLAFHLEHRRPMLARFLDALGWPHEDGLLDPEFEPEPPDAGTLGRAVSAIRSAFPSEEVDLYLASLAAMDPATWTNLP